MTEKVNQRDARGKEVKARCRDQRIGGGICNSRKCDKSPRYSKNEKEHNTTPKNKKRKR